MSDLGEKMRRAAESLGGFTRDEARMMIVIMDEVVPIAETALNEANLESFSWKASAEQNYAEWEEANKLLDQTIEVLGDLDMRLETWPSLYSRDTKLWFKLKAKLEVIIEGETVRFRETPYGKWIVGCSCGSYFCRHRFKAIPQWKRFKEEG